MASSPPSSVEVPHSPMTMRINDDLPNFVVEHVDTDADGVVHFSRYFSMLESSVLWRLEQIGIGQLPSDHSFAVASAQMTYYRPCRYADQVAVNLQIAGLRATSFTFKGELRISSTDPDAGGMCAAQGQLQFCTVNLNSGRAVRLPSEISRGLTAEFRNQQHSQQR